MDAPRAAPAPAPLMEPSPPPRRKRRAAEEEEESPAPAPKRKKKRREEEPVVQSGGPLHAAAFPQRKPADTTRRRLAEHVRTRRRER